MEQALDVICALGCERVRAYIRALENEQTRLEYQSLAVRQRILLLRELRTIMAVYDGP